MDEASKDSLVIGGFCRFALGVFFSPLGLFGIARLHLPCLYTYVGLPFVNMIINSIASGLGSYPVLAVILNILWALAVICFMRLLIGEIEKAN